MYSNVTAQTYMNFMKRTKYPYPHFVTTLKWDKVGQIVR